MLFKQTAVYENALPCVSLTRGVASEHTLFRNRCHRCHVSHISLLLIPFPCACLTISPEKYLRYATDAMPRHAPPAPRHATHATPRHATPQYCPASTDCACTNRYPPFFRSVHSCFRWQTHRPSLSSSFPSSRFARKTTNNNATQTSPASVGAEWSGGERTGVEWCGVPGC